MVLRTVFFLLTSFFLREPIPANPTQLDLRRSMVKIYAVSSDYSYYTPWQMRSQASSTGSGSIISGNRILTNAHVISNQTFLQVRKAGQAKKYNARVEWVSHTSDLAILSVEDQNFFAGSQPLSIGELPKIRDKVAVYGFPKGGTELSITEGVVSRIEHSYYFHSSAYQLSCQIDAAINSGNSGGPVIQDNKIVGVAFQAYTTGQNIGYMVPAPVVRHFLKDIEDGRFDGIPEMGIDVQNLENPELRLFHGMTQNQTGVVVTAIRFESAATGILQRGDILLSLDHYSIENDGSIEFRPEERTHLSYALQSKQIGESINVTILRSGKKELKKILLKRRIHHSELVPFEIYDTAPRYFIYGGLLFMPLSKNLLMEWGSTWYEKAPKHLLNYYFNGEKSETQREIVLLVKVLSDSINAGYQDSSTMVINSVNGTKITRLEDLIATISSSKDPFVVFSDNKGNKLVFDREKVKKTDSQILKKYRIFYDRSANLRTGNQTTGLTR